jgi:NAD(P)-dependent dehydrogenase (short-subunit alcohol dehydrogenase family)/acyl carrier protein
VLVSGGTSGLGAHIARWLATAGAEHLLLLSRSGERAPAAAQLREQIAALGATATILACDVGEREQLERAIASLPERLPLRAVFHAAGVGVEGELGSLSTEELELALHAKVRGATHLHALTQDEPLAEFVLCSSLAGTLGSARQASYAAANAHLDALALHRRARGLAATSVGWGPWLGEGMASEEAVERELRRRGLEPMAPELALQPLGGALLAREPHLLIADVDWRTYAPALAFARGRPLIEDLEDVRAALGADADASEPSVQAQELRGRLGGMDAEHARETLLQLVRAEAASVLGHDTVEAVAAKRSFRDLGFDSLTAVELRNRLEAATGLRLVTTLAFDYPTPHAIAAHLLEQVRGDSSPQETAQAQLESVERALESLAPDRRAPVLARLRGLLARLEDGERERAGERRDAAPLIERMRSGAATDEELFAFIDRELIPSGQDAAQETIRTGMGEAR